VKEKLVMRQEPEVQCLHKHLFSGAIEQRLERHRRPQS
jgi:hypothetical protein